MLTSSTNDDRSAALLSWVTEEDISFAKKHCPNFVRFAHSRELQQSNVAKVEMKDGLSPAFFKKSCVASLQIKSPRNSDAKWRVTQNSFKNEHQFLNNQALLDELSKTSEFDQRTSTAKRVLVNGVV